MERHVEPEILDGLTADDPRARRSRHDLQRVNFWMGHAGIMQRTLRASFPDQTPRRIVELGAGDGSLLLKIARRLPHWSKVEVVFVDRQQIVSPATVAAFAGLNWTVRNVEADLSDWLALGQPCDVMLANLFLHHFTDAQLKKTFGQIAAQTDFFLACEPFRARFTATARWLLWLIGCSVDTQHDGELSVRAGFQNGELTALWPATDEWKITERDAGLFSHLFVAARGRKVEPLAFINVD